LLIVVNIPTWGGSGHRQGVRPGSRVAGL
jgi:hypothetical protein